MLDAASVEAHNRALHQEARCREKVIRIFRSEGSVWRLVGSLRAEQHEVWSAGGRWLKHGRFLGLALDPGVGGSSVKDLINRRSRSYTEFRT